MNSGLVKGLPRNEYMKEYRRKTKNSATKKYEKTKKGFVMRMYRNMKSRISGIQKKKHHLYKGKSLLDKKIFYDLALSDSDFNRLFAEYENSGYKTSLAPSVNRIDPSIGYEIDNIEFITHSENSRRLSVRKNQFS